MLAGGLQPLLKIDESYFTIVLLESRAVKKRRLLCPNFWYSLSPTLGATSERLTSREATRANAESGLRCDGVQEFYSPTPGPAVRSCPIKRCAARFRSGRSLVEPVSRSGPEVPGNSAAECSEKKTFALGPKGFKCKKPTRFSPSGLHSHQGYGIWKRMIWRCFPPVNCFVKTACQRSRVAHTIPSTRSSQCPSDRH